VAPAQVGGHVGAVAGGLIGPALEVPVLVEGDLEEQRKQEQGASNDISCETRYIMQI